MRRPLFVGTLGADGAHTETHVAPCLIHQNPAIDATMFVFMFHASSLPHLSSNQSSLKNLSPSNAPLPSVTGMAFEDFGFNSTHSDFGRLPTGQFSGDRRATSSISNAKLLSCAHTYTQSHATIRTGATRGMQASKPKPSNALFSTQLSTRHSSLAPTSGSVTSIDSGSRLCKLLTRLSLSKYGLTLGKYSDEMLCASTLCTNRQ